MIVAMTAYNRPDYLRDTLRSLDLAAYMLPERTHLIVQVDPSDRLAEVCEQFAQLRHVDFTSVEVNDERLNLQANTFRANRHAFQYAEWADEDYVLGLPDDLLLAPDALLLAAHLRDLWRYDDEVIFTGLFSNHSAELPPEMYHRTALNHHFGCQAWGCWTDTWEREWLPKWNHGNPISWDQNVNDYVMEGRLQAIPWLSRVTHIGRIGTHATAETFEADKPHYFAGDLDVPVKDFWLGKVSGTRWA